jgi:hypothetical protein
MRNLFLGGGDEEGVSRWLDEIEDKPVQRVAIRELLDVTWQIQESRSERVQAGMIVERAKGGTIHALRTTEVMEIFRTLRRLVGPLVTVDGSYLTLEARPSEIIASLVASRNAMPTAATERDAFLLRKEDLANVNTLAN